MKKIIKENLFEFTRGGDPLDTLGIGYTAKIYKFFDDLGINRNNYTIEDKKIIFEYNLDLDGNDSLVELPDNLIIHGYLSLEHCNNLIKLPNNLKISKTLYLNNCISLKKLPNNLTVGTGLFLYDCTSLLELPEDLVVLGNIYIYEDQTELLKWLKSSKFKNKLSIK